MKPAIRQSGANRIGWMLCLVAVAYAVLFGFSFLADPLGQVPVLDARENVAWAQMIRADAVPAEPMYRALLYAWILAALPFENLPIVATLIGVICHLASALLVGLIAQRLWRSEAAAYVGGLLYAVYPVALYFSVQILDITFSTTLFLAAIYLLLCWRDRPAAWYLALGVGLLGGLAVAARPNFLPAVICLPFAALFFSKRSVVSLLLIVAGSLMTLGGQGLVNKRLSGEFRILPWQGAYNLYAANRDGANGKFYMQQLSFDEVPAGSNTTRMESEWLFQTAVGEDQEPTVGSMSEFWREQLKASIKDDPARWLGLMGRKVVYVLNDWEQYNNLTYAYHKARWPILTFNPLGWGLLIIGAFVGLYIGVPRVERHGVGAIALLGLAYAAGLLLFFVSARFRLPLAPLLCVAVAGSVYGFSSLTRKNWAVLGVGSVLLAGVTFGNWFDARDRASFIQDESLLAKASGEVGDDVQALELSRSVLQKDPERVEAQRIETASLFNLWLVTRELQIWSELVKSVERVQVADGSVAFIHGVVLWREGQGDTAKETWLHAVQEFGMDATASRDALQAVGAIDIDPSRADSVRAIQELLELEQQ